MSTKGQKPKVPKFSSFSFKPKQNQKDEEGVSNIEGENEQQKRAQEDQRRASATDVSRRSTESRDSKHKEFQINSDVSRRPAASESGSNDSYTIDKRGDSLIRRYGSNSRYDVPAYRRFGSGHVLGAEGFLIINKEVNRDEFSIRGYYEGNSAVRADRRSILGKGVRNKARPVRIRKDTTHSNDWAEDFLPLKSTTKRKRGDAQSDDSTEYQGPSYRSIHGKSKAHDHSDSDEVYSSDSSVSSSESSRQKFYDPVKAKTIELSGKVRDHPADIDAWLELVDHQNALLRISENDGHRATQAEVKSFADIKFSILEKALAHASNSNQRESLLLRIMREGSKIWDHKNLAKRWDDLMKDHGTSFDLWNAYVNFRQADLATFRYDDIKQLYVNRLRSIETELALQKTNSESQFLYDQLVFVFLKATRLISDAGFAEQAIAAWQAVLELNFCRPSSLPDSSSIAVPLSFQEFWESEVLRIGEESAKGWSGFTTNGGTEEVPVPKSLETGYAHSTQDGYKAWAAAEQRKALCAKIPARTMDDGTEDDPYRVIMYADIEDLLVYIPTQILSRVRPQFLDAFLVFHHLPPAFGTNKAILDILQDEILNSGNNTAFRVESKQNQSCVDLEMTEESPRALDFSQDYQRVRVSLELLFPSSQWFEYTKSSSAFMSPEQYKLVLHTLKQLALSFGYGEIASYYLAFESLTAKNDVKRTSKALLKQYTTDIDLYIGYSRLQYAMGEKTTAQSVLSAALNLPAVTARDRLRLCMASAWMELEDRNLDKSTYRLYLVSKDASDATTTSPTQNLRTRRLLSSNRDHSISSGDYSSAVDYAGALALFEYLTQSSGKEPQSQGQGDVWSAIESVSVCSVDFSSRGLASSQDHEKLLQFAARLLYYHATHGPFRPAFLREKLAKYIQFFPQNTIFLHLYAWREARISIDDRVRSILDKYVLIEPHDCVSSRVFAIRQEAKTGNAHSTRAAFEHALESEACRHHTGLWTSYIRFCHETKELRSKAKGVFYRAIQNCPWSKEVFIEAFVTLVKDMDSSELQSVYNTLCEKGLRVHIDLPGFLEDWKHNQKQRKDGAK